MKLQISFDLTNLDKALEIASHVSDYADILEIGTILLLRYGIKAVEDFRRRFPEKTLLADTKIIDRGGDFVSLFSDSGANWITVMSGTSNRVIHSVGTNARKENLKVMVDLLDSNSFGQSALEAKNLGADVLLFHQSYDEEDLPMFLDQWNMVRGNTDLPIYISANIKRDNVENIIALKPDGIIVGKAITDADDPAGEAKFFYDLCSKN